MVSWYYLVSYLVWYFSWYSIVRHFYGIVTTLVHCHLNYCIIVLIVTNVVFDICMDQTYTVIYRIHQNRSSPWIVAFQSNGLRPNAGQTNPVDLRDMLTSACPRSLSHFLLSISSLALIRGTVILHSSSRFKQTLSTAFHPSSSPSLTHIHKSLPFGFAHKCIFPLSHLYQTSQGLTPRWKRVCQGCFLPWAGHMSPADHKKILRPAVLANTHTSHRNDKRSDKDTHSIMHRSTSTYLLFPTRSTRLLSVLMPSVMGDDCTACYLFR